MAKKQDRRKDIKNVLAIFVIFSSRKIQKMNLEALQYKTKSEEKCKMHTHSSRAEQSRQTDRQMNRKCVCVCVREGTC